jgi:GAF domain-containing protein
MRRGPKPAKAKVEAKPPIVRKSRKDEGSRVRDLETRLGEALEREKATGEILRVIGISSTDIQPVFATVAATAARLCKASDASIFRLDGDRLRRVAHHGSIPAGVIGEFTLPLVHGSFAGRSVLDGRIVHVADGQMEANEFPEGSEQARRLGFRALLCIPLIREGVAIGVITLRDTEVRLFTDRQVTLLQTFADQAVIAIENVRLFNETKEALERQTATSEILRIISSSPTNLQPVLDAVSENASRLCEASDAVILLLEGTHLRTTAHHGQSFAAAVDRPATRGGVAGRAVLDRETIHLPDVFEAHDFPMAQQLSRVDGSRTVLATPLMREGVAIGVILIRRGEVRPFSDKQIELLQTFADQAVIAIENVRLFKELEARNRDLTEALDRQTATSEILRVIASSPTDPQPVFSAIAESAKRLLGGFAALITRLIGDDLHLGALTSTSPAGDEAARARFPRSVTTFGIHTVAARTRAPFAVADIEADQWLSHPGLQEMARARGWRSFLAVPMLQGDQVLGTIGVSRREAGAFKPEEIALLETFADQAVIAIENVRLFKELQEKNQALTTAHAQVTEALEQQTATSEILRVISSSPTDEQPVFNAIVQSARRLCEAAYSVVFLVDAGQLVLKAVHGVDESGIAALQQAYPLAVGRDTTSGRAIIDQGVVHVPDSWRDSEYAHPLRNTIALRSILSVPIFRDGQPIGAISVWRGEARAFTDKQVALLQTFTEQAVIAIENVRLFTELQASNRELTTALDTQTATSDILRVISRSQTDVQPVFEAILVSAVRLLGAYSGSLTRRAGDQIELAALTSTDDAGDAAVRARYPQPLQSEDFQALALRDRAPLNIADAQTDPRLPEATRTYARARGWRSAVMVPLLRHGEAVGTISVTRRDSGGFTDDEIALLKTFADQAVIAIENVRLFTELEEKNSALTAAHAQVTEALEQQTATSEILSVISSSPTDVQPVFEAIVRNAGRLCEAASAALNIVEGDVQRKVAEYGPESFVLRIGETRPITRTSLTGRAMLEGRTIHIVDVRDPDAMREYPDFRYPPDTRACLATPLLREGSPPVGALFVFRTKGGPFTERHAALLKTFADQAIIAIENVRLFTELQARNRDLSEALDRQTATADILRVISQAQTDVQPVFEAIADSAVRLLGAEGASVGRYDGELLSMAAARGGLPGSADVARERLQPPHRPTFPPEQVVLTKRVNNVVDIETDPSCSSEFRRHAAQRGFRSYAAVPMLRGNNPLGMIVVSRAQPGGFSSAEIALLQTFADQAVIAIENARLLSELRARTGELTRSVEQLTALSDVGRAVSSSLDLEIVLTTIVSRAVDLSGLDGGVVSEYDETAEEFVQRAVAETGGVLAQALRGVRYQKGEGVIGRTAITREPVQVPDITVPGAYDSRVRENLIESGMRAVLAVPMIHQDRLIGCLGVTRKRPGEFPAETIDLLRTFATQSALAIQNARLFREIEEKSRQLEVASQHKSEFLANMSHELRTPLNAIIGFSEVLSERMFGDLNEKQEEYLKDIYASGTHLLSLINDILDLSKIEAGRMELELTDFDLPTALDNALILVRERAGRRGIALEHSVDDRLGEIRGDERKVKQVLLNLLSNAIKFTPEGGRIEVEAISRDGFVEVAVSDSGIGIAPEDQERVFEEFRQVGTAEKKAEGTGLGLTLCRKFVELHGGRIWVKSQVGGGSTFTFTIPMRRGE